MEARLKGAGMHWARPHVNPMVALRDLLCSVRWEHDWPQIATRVRADHLKQRQQRQRVRWMQRRVATTTRAGSSPVVAAPLEPSEPEPVKVTPSQRHLSPSHHVKQPYRPPANHPWRHSPIGRARFKSYRSGHEPKL